MVRCYDHYGRDREYGSTIKVTVPFQADRRHMVLDVALRLINPRITVRAYVKRRNRRAAERR
jgi:hypothetical protein